MSGLNKMLTIGYLGTDPEMRYLPSGVVVTSFRLAASRSYTTSDGERRDETEWFTVKAWRNLGELCNQYLTKGRRVYVEGRLNSRSWQGQDGQNRFTNEITAEQVLFLDGVGGQGAGGRGPEQGGQGFGDDQGGAPPVADEEDAEDLPW
jgi:single-strand DNA-binding protein